MAQFEVTFGPLEGDRQTVRVAGELAIDTAMRLEMALDDAVDQGARRLEVDLTETTFLDSTGLAAIMAAHRRLQQRGGALVLTGASDTVMRVLELSAIDAVLMPRRP